VVWAARKQPTEKWHLDEGVITVQGKKHRLWRAVDSIGEKCNWALKICATTQKYRCALTSFRGVTDQQHSYRTCNYRSVTIHYLLTGQAKNLHKLPRELIIETRMATVFSISANAIFWKPTCPRHYRLRQVGFASRELIETSLLATHSGILPCAVLAASGFTAIRPRRAISLFASLDDGTKKGIYHV